MPNLHTLRRTDYLGEGLLTNKNSSHMTIVKSMKVEPRRRMTVISFLNEIFTDQLGKGFWTDI
jgi:hypothetical protein